jgi:hypothetical protein
MKKIKISILSQVYEIEIEEEFYEYIKDDIEKINSLSIKELLNLLLMCKYETYKNDIKMNKLLKKLEI